MYRISVVSQVLCLVLLLALHGCSEVGSKKERDDAVRTSDEPLVTQAASSQPVLLDPPTEERVTMRGRVVHKRWTKTFESWNAGGSNYFVLELPEGRSVILRPSDRVKYEGFLAFAGKQVEVAGHVVEPQPWEPSGLEPHPGRATRRGGGFRVEQIRVIAE